MGRRDREDWEKRRKKREDKAEEEIITGGAMMLVFGFMMINLTGWLIFPFVFAGLLPFAQGIRRYIKRRLRNRLTDSPIRRASTTEKQILLSAKEHNGVVTPTIIALETDLNLKEAEKELQRLTEEGHATMEISKNGTIEYHFPELKRELPPQ